MIGQKSHKLNEMDLNVSKPVFGEKTCLWGLQTTKAQTILHGSVHPRSLISTFVILLLKIIISKLATSELSIF